MGSDRELSRRLLTALADGRARTPIELAIATRADRLAVADTVASFVAGGQLSAVRSAGRIYVRRPDAAGASGGPSTLGGLHGVGIRAGRTCYGHLAGSVGVALTGFLSTGGYLDEEWRATDAGRRLFAGWGVPESPRLAGRGCLDATERRMHLGGPLGRALCAALFNQGWMTRTDAPRAVRVTPAGRAAFAAVGFTV